MNRIFVIMGKSASGKDSIYAHLNTEYRDKLKSIVIYTTRPMRDGEVQGREYYFCSPSQYEEALGSGRVIEHRTYDTVFGPWHYYTVDDGQFDGEKDCLMIATLEAYNQLRNYFGQDRVVPLYIEVDDYTRLTRALDREREQINPAYSEMCRRFLADCGDFSEEKLSESGISTRFINNDFERCVEEIKEFMEI